MQTPREMVKRASDSPEFSEKLYVRPCFGANKGQEMARICPLTPQSQISPGFLADPHPYP